MGTTSNYSWPYPESTDPVADGAADIQALADAADTTGRAIELATVQRFADATARNTALSGIEVEGMFAFLQDTDVLTYWDGSAWVEFSTGVQYGAATGGSSSTITVGGESYTMLTFTSSGTLTVTTPGVFDLLIVGGGGGGVSDSIYCGGGGAGGLMYVDKIYLDANQTVTIGAGGALRTQGTGSVVGGIIAPTGSTGRSRFQERGGGHGSGGGGGYSLGTAMPGDGVTGNNGGNYGGGGAAGGGGGGAGAAGSPSSSSSNIGGPGGAGADVSAWRGEPATTTYYAGGGGGSSGSTVNVAPGIGGGGYGEATNGLQAGGTNTGGGGGSRQTTGGAGAGGSGIVLVRFRN